jgi:transcriptional regulator
MYIPLAFNVPDARQLAAFIEQNSFATLVSEADGRPFASHLPLLHDFDGSGFGRLVGHMARANPQWQHFADGREVLAIFHGPHAYVSPRWYTTKVAVPTWNYAVVHAYGRPQLISDPAEFEQAMRRIVARYEDAGPDAELPAETRSGLDESNRGISDLHHAPRRQIQARAESLSGGCSRGLCEVVAIRGGR